jgi:hypothetical protein
MTEAPPPFRFTRESRIRVDADGHVWHEGERILHEGLAKGLAAWIDYDDATGRYVMRNSLDWCFVTVDHTPLVVRRVIPHDDALQLELSDGSAEALRPDSLRVAPDGAVYTYVREASLLARFDRAAAFALLERAVPVDEGFALRVGDRDVPLTMLAEGETPSPRPPDRPSTSAGEGGTRTPAP